jgi:GT2 family glycosyltransferase
MHGDSPGVDSCEQDHIALITRLYLVVLGRPPDPGGLAAFAGHLRNGRALRDLAAEFLGSDEFLRHAAGAAPAAVLSRNALGADAPLPGGKPDPHPPAALADLATSLILSPLVQARLPVLPALYPEGVRLADAAAYRTWLAYQPSPAAPTYAPHGGGGATSPPVVSFVLSLDRPNIPWLKAAVTSVLAGAAPRAELLITARGRFPRMLRCLAGSEPRLRLVWAPPWAGEAARFNRALAHGRGLFAARIGQHDQLSATALAVLAGAAEAADILIADDDALDEQGLRHSPRLGTAWDPDRVIATGCPGLIAIRTSLLRQLGGMRRAGGAEEWELLLRAAAAIPPARIAHIPAVLLSRRGPLPPHGTAPTHQRAARRILRAGGHHGGCVREERGTLRVVYPLPRMPPRASIIIPTRDRAELLRICMDGLLRRTDYPALEVVIVDNGSTAPEALALLHDLARDQRVRVLPQPGPFNWSALNNAGVGQMRGEVAVLLNNDIDVLDSGWLRELVSQALRPEVGIVGAKLLYPDRSVQHAGVVLGPAGRATHMWRHAAEEARGYLDQLIVTRQATSMTGACLALRREVYIAAGGCDAEYLPITWNDTDLCLRIQALGLRAIWTPHACLLHLEQASRGSDDTPERQQRFVRERAWMRARWNGLLDADPFLSPHLIPSEADPEPRLAVR